MCSWGHSEGTVSTVPAQVWLCLHLPRTGLPSVRVITETAPLKYLPAPLKVLLTAFFIFFFLYLFKEPCNFSPPPFPFSFLYPVLLNSLKLALCLLTPN